MADMMGTDDPRWMLNYLQAQRLARIKRAGGSAPVDPVFPAKDFYFTDFAGIANSTKLRDLPGWSDYSSIDSTHASRDQWQVQSEAVTRLNVSNDTTTSPGIFVVGRDTSSTNHIYKCRLVTLPNSGARIVLVVAATAENNCVLLEVTNSSGIMQNFVIRKNVGGTLTQLLSQAGSASALGRRLQAGDDIELHVLDQRVHLFVNGYRITPALGSDLDTGGAFTKGTICGHGTASGAGCVFDDEYMAPLASALTLTATEIFWPGSTVLGGRSVPVSGTYAGDVQALDYRVVNATTNATVRDWTRISEPTIAGGAWSSSVFVAMCDTAVNPKVRIQVRAANDTDARALSVATTVGITVGSYGQSNSAYRGQVSATSHNVSNAYTWSDDASSVWQGGTSTTTTRSQLWATQIAAASGIPCGVVITGVGSASIALLTTDFWPGTVAKLDLAQTTGYISAWLWTQGESESNGAGVFDVTAYRSNFDVLLGLLRGAVAVNNSVPVGVCVIGKKTDAHISGQAFGDANWSSARATLFGLTDKPGTYIATNLSDSVMVDALHYVADAYVENGRRAGLSMRKALGYGGYDGRGPIITGAVRSGAVVTLGVDLNGAASIAGTGLTNYDVSVDNFVTTLPISSVAVAGSSIVITLAADPGAPVKVRSFYGMTYGTPVIAIGTYADGTTIPVEPLYIPAISS